MSALALASCCLRLLFSSHRRCAVDLLFEYLLDGGDGGDCAPEPTALFALLVSGEVPECVRSICAMVSVSRILSFSCRNKYILLFSTRKISTSRRRAATSMENPPSAPLSLLRGPSLEEDSDDDDSSGSGRSSCALLLPPAPSSVLPIEDLDRAPT